MKKSCVIIGGGLGGLFTGALLSVNGIKTTVLEKNSIIGGGLQCFCREGKAFDTGMHIVGGLNEGGNIYRLCSYLGILDKLKIHTVDSSCMDTIRIGESEKEYHIPSGKENFIKRLSEYFPHEKEGIENYVEELFRLTEELPLFYLKEVPEEIPVYSEKFIWPADRLIAHYINDAELRSLLAYLNPLYGGVKGHTPAYIHALINVFYIRGAFRFKGGSLQLARLLKDVIGKNGGEVISGEEVMEITVDNNQVTCVRTGSDTKYLADYFVSTIHPTELLKFLPKGALGTLYEKRLEEIPVSNSAFSLFIDFKPDSFPFIDETCHYYSSFDSIWGIEDSNNPDWPGAMIYLTPPEVNQGAYATKMLVLCMMEYDEVRIWEDTLNGERPEDYYRWKEERAGKIISRLEKIYPGFRDKIANVYSASPLTIRDFYHTKEGSLYGYRKDCEDIYISRLSSFTKLNNLFLAGQNVYLHGICGVPLTSVCTADAILGRNNILNQINNEN